MGENVTACYGGPSEDWGVLLALGFFGGEVGGKVRLNKILAMLQCSGVPLKNKFVNHRLGPYDEKIDIETANLQSTGSIEIRKVATEYENDAFIYSMLGKGFSRYKNEILPYVSALPYARALKRVLVTTRGEILAKRTRDIVDNIHKALYLDDMNQFCRRVDEVHLGLSKMYARIQGRFDKSCPICLEIASSTDLAIEALAAIKNKEWLSPDSGKNFVLRNAEIISHYVKALSFHEHIRDPRFKEDKTSELREDLSLRYHCVEYNSVLYGIIDHSFFADDSEEPKGLISESEFIHTIP